VAAGLALLQHAARSAGDQINNVNDALKYLREIDK
jgi:hypothetical protein